MASLADLLRSQNFGKNDSAILSTINHPITAARRGLNAFRNNINTVAGLTEQYDNPNPLAGYTPEQQAEAALNLAGLLQTGAFPFAPKGSGTLGTVKNLNNELFDKYLSTGKLSPENKTQLILDSQEELPDYYNAVIKNLRKNKKPINDETIFALLKTKLLGSQKELSDLSKPKNYLWSPGVGIHDTLEDLGFQIQGNHVSQNNDVSSMSTYYKHPEAGVTVRLSDHPPVYARSTGNDIMLHPGSYQSDDEALDAIKNLLNPTGAPKSAGAFTLADLLNQDRNR